MPVDRPGVGGPGVPISAILFGGRRASVIPLVTESFDWEHGVFMGATVASETTAAAAGAIGNLRFDPFAMLPFCGYNMADYIQHWLDIGKATDTSKLPKIFYVNWFRKGADGKFLWPGYGENSRVLKWIVERVSGRGEAVKTPIGYLPAPGALDTNGLDMTNDQVNAALKVDAEEWRNELPKIAQHFSHLGERVPADMIAQVKNLEERLRV
jgi:phosphoenolpyruvate carboxykinase (GTP)